MSDIGKNRGVTRTVLMLAFGVLLLSFFYRLAAATEFSSVVTISDISGSGLPDVASEGDNVYVVWRVDTFDPNTGAETRQLRFRRSTNGGENFEPVQVLVSILDNVVVTESTPQFIGFPAVAAFGSNVYVVFVESFPGSPDPDGGPPVSKTFFLRSTDGGANFEPPVEIFSSQPHMHTADIAVDGGGIIHVVRDDGPALAPGGTGDILYRRSTDGGASFSAAVNISNTANATSTVPRVAAAGTRVAVVWIDSEETIEGPTGEVEILFVHSTESGMSFSTPPVDLSATPFTASLFPAIAIGDAIHVVWNEGNRLAYRASSDGANFPGTTFLSGEIGAADEPVFLPDITASGTTVSVIWTSEGQSPSTLFGVFFRRSDDGVAFDASQNLAQLGEGFSAAIAGSPVKVVWDTATGGLGTSEVRFRREILLANQPPTASADGPYTGVAGVAVQMDASASSDPEGASLTFTWDFGDGSTLVTTAAAIEHTYASAGTFIVTLVVNDGQLDSAPFTTTATISDAFTGGGQREDVDAFLAYASPLQRSTDLPAGTTSFDVTIIYGPTIDASTFQAFLNGVPVTGFTPTAGTSEIVIIPLAPGRNVLLFLVEGVRSDGRTATDRDRLTFIVP